MKLQFFAWFILVLGPAFAGEEPIHAGKGEEVEDTAEPFEFMVEPFNEQRSEYLLSLKCSNLGVDEDLWVSDVVIYWITPDDEGLIVPIRPIDENIFAIKVQLPQDQGVHEMKISFCLRDEDGTIQRIYERTYTLEMPEATLHPEDLKIFPSDGLVESAIGLDSKDPTQLTEGQPRRAGWMFFWGMVLGAAICAAGLYGYAFHGARASRNAKSPGKRLFSSAFGNVFGKKQFQRIAPQDKKDVKEPEKQLDGKEEDVEDHEERKAESLGQSDSSETTIVLDLPEDEEGSDPADMELLDEGF